MSFTAEETAKFYERNTFRGVAVFVVDMALLVGLIALTLCTPWYVQLPLTFLIGAVIAALFVVGHDAAHQALTPHRGLNRVIGTIAFLPSMHPYSLWVKLHNIRHHMWTNLLGKDDVWVPLDMEGYKALPSYSRALYRFYRTPYGPLLYYLIEFWWKKFSWPTKKHFDGEVKRVYIVDTLITWAFAAAYVSFLVVGAGRGWFGGEVRPWWNSVLFGAVLPFLIWNVFSGLSIFLHHTHPKIIWYKDEAEWRRVSKANTSVHAVFPGVVQFMFHFIQEHSAHHLRPSVPLYHLKEAQECLEHKDDVDVVHYDWTFARHGNICRRCKLYDFDAKRWMDFSGEYTSPPPSKKRVETPDSPDVLETASA
ncbi:MAG: fatty acid desaturase [Planctomycetales bacterium]|nr:fatty acid desaturase [Planctomycetales bacterium]